jgi:hypothetical protein
MTDTDSRLAERKRALFFGLRYVVNLCNRAFYTEFC